MSVAYIYRGGPFDWKDGECKGGACVPFSPGGMFGIICPYHFERWIYYAENWIMPHQIQLAMDEGRKI